MSHKLMFTDAPNRILMTADTVGGVWTYALELARGLEPYGVRIDIATMGAPVKPQQREEACRLRNVTLHESRFKLEWMDDPWEDLEQAGDWLLSLDRALRPDVIHLNGYVHAALKWSGPTLVVGHSCCCSWWDAVHGGPAPDSWDRYRSEVRRGLQAADLVVAPSTPMLAALNRTYGPLPRRRVIYNGRDPVPSAPSPKEEFVLTAGRIWDQAKNIAALNSIADGLAWPIYVAGDCSSPSGGMAEMGGIHPLGFLPHEVLASWMARASIYALPAKYEPFGLSALEAANTGCALVLGDIHSLREIWGDAALYVDPGDNAALRRAIQRLIDDPAALRAYGVRARERARHYTTARMAAAYMASYVELIHARTDTRLAA